MPPPPPCGCVGRVGTGVDNNLGHLNTEFGVLRAMVDQNRGVVENFLEDVNIRVETAMTDYKNEMHEEFQLTEKVNEAMKAEILAQFESSAPSAGRSPLPRRFRNAPT